jgi:hypothetical protein
MIRVIYGDDLTYNLVHAACKVLSKIFENILKNFYVIKV